MKMFLVIIYALIVLIIIIIETDKKLKILYKITAQKIFAAKNLVNSLPYFWRFFYFSVLQHAILVPYALDNLIN